MGQEQGDWQLARTLPGNALVVLGSCILVFSISAGVIADVPLRTVLAQTSLPVLVGVGLIAYGTFAPGGTVGRYRRTILTWIGYGLLSFFAVGLWFGLLSRVLDTSYLLAVVASLSIGATFGALVGVYAARLRRANTELQSQKDRMERFAGILSHDLRNPLTVAKGRLELAEEECDSDHLGDIAQSLDRMDALIDDVLRVVREGTEVTDLETVDLGGICRRCWETVETTDATLAVEASRELRADPDRLRQLFENLFRNAVEHGGPDVTVTVGDMDDGFYVADDGPGIPREERERVFEVGYSTSADGTGFGLNIVREIVDAHGWEIRVTDSDDGGARFEISGVDG